MLVALGAVGAAVFANPPPAAAERGEANGVNAAAVDRDSEDPVIMISSLPLFPHFLPSIGARSCASRELFELGNFQLHARALDHRTSSAVA